MTKKFLKVKFLYRAFSYRFLRDRAEMRYLLKSVRKNDFVLDIGAYKGGYLYWLKSTVGKRGKVFAFEPQLILHDYLKEVINKCRYDNVSLFHAGVSSKNGTMQLFVPKEPGLTSPGATYESRPNPSVGHFMEIKVHHLDSLLKDRKQKITFIKMDVEGHELDVFKGADRISKEDRPKILFECEKRHPFDKQIDDVFDHLKELRI